MDDRMEGSDEMHFRRQQSDELMLLQEGNVYNGMTIDDENLMSDEAEE